MVTLVNGSLNYAPYANIGQTNAVNTVPDFSRAGYKGGGVQIPFVASVTTVNASDPGDDGVNIQNAIDYVAGLTPDANGFRGAVQLTAGDYSVGDTLNVNTGGIVIRGAGSGTGGTKVTYTKTVTSDCLIFAGTFPVENPASAVSITDSFVPVGATSFNVSDASSFSVDEMIYVRNNFNQAWINDLNTDDLGNQAPWDVTTYQLKNPRQITAINGNTITIDSSIIQTIETQYGGGQIEKYDSSGLIENVGVEGINFVSYAASSTDENHGWNAVNFTSVRNAWARQLTSEVFAYACVAVRDFSEFVTVEDCAQLDAASTLSGGRRYSFRTDDSAYILFQRCFAREGRHDFASGSRDPGPCVFVDGHAINCNNDCGPHHRYSMGHLYDNIDCRDLDTQNRHDSGSGHGWTGGQIMFWNSVAARIICDAPKGAMSWCTGCKGNLNAGTMSPRTEPQGIITSFGSHVTPRSLYYKQLEERLGTSALRNVIIPAQNSADIWAELLSWQGAGLFDDDIVMWTNKTTLDDVNDSMTATGVVRNLNILQAGLTATWSKVSGPGTVTFTAGSSLETGISCDIAGTYVVGLTVNSEPIISVTVQVLSSTSPETVVCVDDAYVRGGSSSGINYNSDPRLLAKDQGDNVDRKSFLKFDLSNVVMTSSDVLDAKLRMYLESHSGSGGATGTTAPITLYQVSNNTWDETTVTWSSAPGFGSSLDAHDVINSDVGTWIEFDVTSYVISKFTGDHLVSFGFWSSSPDVVAFTSKEGTNKPELVLTPGTPPPPPTSISVHSVSTEQSPNVGANTLDGDISDPSRWSASGFSQWIIYDNGTSPAAYDTLKVYAHKDRAYQYKIYGSDTLSDVQNELAGALIVDRSTNTSTSQPITNTLSSSVTYRYLKMTVSGASGYTGTWVSINEFELA
jgi:hypothetical protein